MNKQDNQGLLDSTTQCAFCYDAHINPLWLNKKSLLAIQNIEIAIRQNRLRFRCGMGESHAIPKGSCIHKVQ